MCLELLYQLMKHHPLIQKFLFDKDYLTLIYKLSSTKVKVKGVGKYAEQIVVYLLGKDNIVDESAFKYVKGLKQKELAKKKRRAKMKRMKLMKKMQMSKKNNKMIEKMQKTMKFTEEKSVFCKICKDGY